MGQQVIVGMIVLGAVLFIARRMWSAIASARASKQAGCDSGCGCAPVSAQPSEKPVRHQAGIALRKWLFDQQRRV